MKDVRTPHNSLFEIPAMAFRDEGLDVPRARTKLDFSNGVGLIRWPNSREPTQGNHTTQREGPKGGGQNKAAPRAQRRRPRPSQAWEDTPLRSWKSNTPRAPYRGHQRCRSSQSNLESCAAGT